MFDELTINRTSGKPVSLQIAQFVKEKIANSDIAPGSKFPSTQEFVKQVGVGPHTLRQAMKSLEREGLVKSTPRLGTVVCDSALSIVLSDEFGKPLENGAKDNKIRRIGVFGLIQHVDEKKNRYNVETAEGIMQESERQGIATVVLPSSFSTMNGSQMYDELAKLGCEGFVWASSHPLDDEALNFIWQRGIKIISRSRAQRKDSWPCIQANHEDAGFDLGNYFCNQKINDLLILSHFDFNNPSDGCDINSYPIAMRQGLVRAFEQRGVKPAMDIRINVHENKQTSHSIHKALSNAPKQQAVIFTNGYQFLEYLNEMGKEGYELLAGRKIVAISNLTINYQLRPLVRGLDLMVLVDNFKEMGRLMVGNLLGILDGYFDSATTTLVNVDFAKFEDSFKDED